MLSLSNTGARAWNGAQVLGDEAGGGGRGDRRSAVVGGDDGPDHLLRRGVLEQETVGLPVQRGPHSLIIIEGGEDDDSDLGHPLLDLGEELKTVHSRHPHIGDEHVDPVVPQEAEGVLCRPEGAEHLDLLRFVQVGPQSLQDKGVVINDDDPDLLRVIVVA